MEENRTPGRRVRSVVPSRLALTSRARSETQEIAVDALLWALDLLREHEIALIEHDREAEIAFGRWLTKPRSNRRYVVDVVRDELSALLRGLVNTRLTTTYQPGGRFAQVGSVAAVAGLDRGTLFSAWEPRALLLVHLMHAYLAQCSGPCQEPQGTVY